LSSFVGIPQSIALVIAIAIALAIDLYAGYLFVCPMRAAIGPPPADLGATPISFPSRSGATLRGWYVPGAPGHGAMLLVHGIHADRAVMLPRARWLHRAGYAVLLFDLQAHGESTGDRITFGVKEGLDVQSALGVLREKAPGERVGVIAVSLGGAAALLGPQPLDVDALVLESVFPTIAQATRNRVGAFGARLLLWQLRPRLGVGVNDLRPIEQIGRVRAPIFIISGAVDRHTTPEESRAMFDAAPEPKELWLVPGAAHEDLYAVAGSEYEQRVSAFLRRCRVGGS
jgi:fermentation-respiration switch protein FrsA (DUF1100 family)